MKLGREEKRESVLSNDDRKASQGFVDLKTKTIEQIEELIERQDKLLQNRSFIAKLPDKGKKIIAFKNNLEAELKKRQEEYQSTCHLLSKLTLNESTLEDLEWNKGKVKNKSEKLDSDDESDSELDPLKLIASHSGTAKGMTKIVKNQSLENSQNGYVDKFCEKYGQNLHTKERFKPNQLKNNDKNVFAVSAEKVKKRLGEKWEVTEATPPVPVYKDTVIISLSESLKLQKEQAEKLKELEKKNASERLLKKSSIKMGTELPIKNITEYRTPKNPFDESVGEEEAEEYYDPESVEQEKTVCYTVTDYDSER